MGWNKEDVDFVKTAVKESQNVGELSAMLKDYAELKKGALPKEEPRVQKTASDGLNKIGSLIIVDGVAVPAKSLEV